MRRARMKSILALLGLAVVSVVSLVVWKLQPWMPAGRAIRLSALTLGGHDFQVWQRKNPDTFEPFATGLFVQDGTNDWRVFLLDFEDTYHPRVSLRREGSGIVVFHGGDRLECSTSEPRPLHGDPTEQFFKPRSSAENRRAIGG
jgi:hypothetical protein